MIKINKGSPPGELAAPAVAKTRNLIKSKAAKGTLASKDFKDHWNNKVVKDQLVKEHHGKCAYCEGRIMDIANGEVEHFRPKTEYKNRYYSQGGGSAKHGGYWWLAYDYRNYLLSCTVCNAVFKGTLFPLDYRNGRPDPKPGDAIPAKYELAIDPAVIDPRKWLRFDPITAKVGPTKPDDPKTVLRAGTTIHLFGLNRAPLVQARMEHLKKLRGLWLFASSTKDHPERAAAIKALEYAKSSHAEFSALAQDAMLAWRDAKGFKAPQNDPFSVQVNKFWLPQYLDCQSYAFRRRNLDQPTVTKKMMAAAAMSEFPALYKEAKSVWESADVKRKKLEFEPALKLIERAGQLYCDAGIAYECLYAGDKKKGQKEGKECHERSEAAPHVYVEWHEDWAMEFIKRGDAALGQSDTHRAQAVKAKTDGDKNTFESQIQLVLQCFTQADDASARARARYKRVTSDDIVKADQLETRLLIRKAQLGLALRNKKYFLDAYNEAKSLAAKIDYSAAKTELDRLAKQANL